MADTQSQRDQQFKPLAPFIPFTHFSSPNNLENPQNISEQKTKRIKKIVRWCGCITALLLICIVIIIVLSFTVYNVQEPEVRMNGVTLINGTFANGGGNVTLLADISVKNPNHFTFRYGNTTTIVYYHGIEIGESIAPAGKAKARRTMRLNVTMEIMAKRVVDNPKWTADLRDQDLDISSYTRMDGKVKILNLFKRKILVELNCTNTYNTTTGLVTHGDTCLGFVSI